jgi:protein-tyrosine phosphatase
MLSPVKSFRRPKPEIGEDMKAAPFWIEGPWRGRLAILPRPRGGDWLEDEARAWRVEGIDAVVSTLTSDEIAELDLAEEAELCQASGVEFIAFPVEDRGLPSSSTAAAELARRLEERLAKGKNVAIHCRQGVGRSALIAACVLVAAGVEAETAWAKVRAARGCPVPDTAEQRAWVIRLAGNRKAFEENTHDLARAGGK